jgi:hypothetical protein
MASWPTGGATGTQRPSTSVPTNPLQQPARHSTARVATTHQPARGELPGWFWVALGCLSVLSVGFAVLFVVVKPSGDAAAAAVAPPPAAAVAPATTAAAAAPAPAAPPTRGGGIHVEQMAAPSSPADMPRRKPKPRVVKVARTPSAGNPATAAAAAPAAAEDAAEDEEPAPRARRAAAARAADEEESEEKTP